ncbi:MAG: glycosyltransferase family 2 protein [Marmoricola sp.]
MATDLVVAVLLLVALATTQRLIRGLRDLPEDGEPTDAHLSVIVPARNEAHSLPRLLDSIGRLDAAVEVIVVDDGSQDRTAGLARAAGAIVLAPGTPPPGWTGKAWACQRGAQRAGSELLLFLDADVVLAPGALRGLLRLHAAGGGLVSVQPYHQVERPYEQLSAYFNAVSLLASGASAGPGGRPMAFGPCLLTSRADYQRAGEHEAVRGAILDDVGLAAAYQQAGLPVRCVLGGRAVRMRSYPDGLGQLAAGWTKNVASGASATAPRPLVATMAWVCAHHAIGVGLILALVGVLVGSPLPWAYGSPALWLLGWVVAALQLRLLLGRIGSFRWWTWALFPVPLAAFDLLFARSVLLTGVRRSVRWQGRDVPVTRGSDS